MNQKELEFRQKIYKNCEFMSDLYTIMFAMLFIFGYELSKILNLFLFKYFFLAISVLIFVDFIITIFIPIDEKLKFIDKIYTHKINLIYKNINK